MKIAFVYDRVNKFGGAERVLLALHEIWPEAPLYTVIYDKQKVAWAKDFKIIPSFLNSYSFVQKNHELLPLLTPLAFENFLFEGYDVILSITSSDAKAILTKPATLHICYCLTPTRFVWSGYHDYVDEPGMYLLNGLAKVALKLLATNLRYNDYLTSRRPDVYFAISKTVAVRISKYYKQPSEIIYPPIDTDIFNTASIRRTKKIDKYYLIVSRLVPYKSIDYVISAFNKIGSKLIIVGNGLDEKRLKNASRINIEYVNGDLTDEKLCWYYQNCEALIFPGEEDFGLTAVEVQACGKPVIGYNRGGVTETVVPGVTGLFYRSKTSQALIDIINKFKITRFDADKCRMNALSYSKKKFQLKIEKTVKLVWNEYQKKL